MPAHSHVFSRIFAQIDGGGIFPGGNNDSPTLQDNTNLTGGNQPHENRPPYYALAFIMKL